jgi:hypothetical protein
MPRLRHLLRYEIPRNQVLTCFWHFISLNFSCGCGFGNDNLAQHIDQTPLYRTTDSISEGTAQRACALKGCCAKVLVEDREARCVGRAWILLGSRKSQKMPHARRRGACCIGQFYINQPPPLMSLILHSLELSICIVIQTVKGLLPGVDFSEKTLISISA